MNTVEKKYPKGTTREQWDAYEIAKANHEAYCQKIMPKAEHYGFDSSNLFDTEGGWLVEGGEESYKAAMSKWNKVCFMDAPNEPGYYRANND